MPTLRAFLLIRQAHDKWLVSVHRDLDSLITAWKPYEGQEATTGVIHVGFDRHGTEAFEETAERYPGRMLLTAAARYALGSLSDCAPQAAGEADHLPLYVALSGWGYKATVDEIEFAQVPSASIPPSLASGSDEGDAQNEVHTNGLENEQINWPIRSNWIQSLSSMDPELIEIAKNAGIVDEKSYFGREYLLDAAHRTRLGYCRLRILLEDKDCEDPTEIARSSPPWLLVRPTLSLGLSVRAENSFRAAHINRVVDIARFSRQGGLLSLPNFGQKTYRDVTKTILAVLQDGPFGLGSRASLPDTSETAENDACRVAQGAGFVEILDTEINNLPKGRDFVVKMRMGFGEKRSTLQEIADVMGITRERVRQIEAGANRTLSARTLWHAFFVPKIEAMLASRSEPLPLLGLDIYDPWFRGIEDIPEAVDYCLEHFCGGRLSLIQADCGIFISRLSTAEWNEVVKQGEDMLEAAVGQNWQLSHARSMIDGLLMGKGEELRPELWATVARHARFAGVSQGESVLVAYGRGVEQIVEAILANSDRPLHHTEIARKIAEQFDRPIDARYAHAATGRVGLLYGRGTYGLMKHFPFIDYEADLVVAETENLIVSGKAGRQWHCSEICEVLAERGIDFEGRLNPYVVNIALQRSKSLAYLGRHMWTVAAGRKLTSVHRIDVHQAIVSLLRGEGRPLSYLEIREKLAKERGLGNHFQIFQRDSLIHLGRGIWGLLDRDLPLNETEQEAVFDEIAEILCQRQSGLHVTEIVSTLMKTRELAERVDGVTLMALAQRSGRMRVSYGQYLYFTEWGGPRRMQLTDAIKTALQQSSNGLRAQGIVEAASALIGRPINSQNIYGSLSTIGAEWSEETGRWTLVDANEESGDEEDEPGVVEIPSKSI